MKKRVCCLYRVSTDKQVDYDGNNEADIPMQRKACHKFAEKMGWDIVFEEQEDGVSGHKVRAENRDKIQLIKELATKKQFDVFLVFMFDRIGRIADETPFVVEWFVKNGIEVWSTQEGEQRFDNHIDKLMNYLRFWQADGESEKTSVRTRTSLGQMVEEGHFKGGVAAFGYDLVKSGRINKRKHEVYDLKVNEAEADIVRMIFDKYSCDGFGAQRIATWLNNAGYKTRSGKMWHPATIAGILRNLTYTGILRSGESRSDVIEELQIISSEQFCRVHEIIKARSYKYAQNKQVPLNTKGKSILSGNVYCGHCGSKLTITTSGKYRKRKDGTVDKKPRIRYVCYGKTRKQTECDGQTGYTMTKLDSIIDGLIVDIFSKMKSIPKKNLIMFRHNRELDNKKALLTNLKNEYSKEFDGLNLLKSEVIKCIKGESKFTETVLSELIVQAEEKCKALTEHIINIEDEISDSNRYIDELSATYDELISWADLYENAEFEKKKMIVNSLIRRVEVFSGYKIRVEFTFDIGQFLNGIDSVA